MLSLTDMHKRPLPVIPGYYLILFSSVRRADFATIVMLTRTYR